MDGSTLQRPSKLRTCTFQSSFSPKVGWQTRERVRCRSKPSTPRCEQGAAWLGDSDLLRLKVGGRNDHGPLNMGPKLQLSLEDAVEMQLQARPPPRCRSRLPVHDSSKIWQHNRQMTVHPTLQALQKNNEPHADHGIEVLYRYTCVPAFYPSVLCSSRHPALTRRGLRALADSQTLIPLSARAISGELSTWGSSSGFGASFTRPIMRCC